MAFSDIRKSKPTEEKREALHISLKYSFTDEKEAEIGRAIISIAEKHGMSAKDVVDNLLEEAIPAFLASVEEEVVEEPKTTILKPKVK